MQPLFSVAPQFEKPTMRCVKTEMVAGCSFGSTSSDGEKKKCLDSVQGHGKLSTKTGGPRRLNKGRA